MGTGESKPVAELPHDLGEAARKFRDYDFPFENLVLEGGGAKGIAYVGAMKVLEEAGIMPGIKRFAGTSAGAITAGLMAIGMKSDEIVKEMADIDMGKTLQDSPWWAYWPLNYASYFRNFRKSYGLFPGQKFLSWYNGVINRHVQKAKKNLTGDITFIELYKIFGKELCTVTYNTTIGCEMYFHTKTTPLATICQAVRQSMSLPVVYEPFKYANEPDFYIDGGVCANFPIDCYDGWWLSMDEQDTFERKLEGATDEAERYFYPEHSGERFQTKGISGEQMKKEQQKTLGLMMYSETQRKAYQNVFIKRLKILQNKSYKTEKDRPTDTKLVKKFEENEKERKRRIEKYEEEMERDLDSKKERLFKVLEAPRNRRDMLKCFREKFPKEELKDFLDGEASEDYEAAFDKMFAECPGGKVTDDIVINIYKNWEPLDKARQKAIPRRIIDSPTELYFQYLEFVGSNKPIKESDVDRSIAIDVDYVSTMDFNMEPADQTFLMRQGAIATLAFLEEYVQKNRLKPRSS
ncbi:uncharacterized protein LOC144864770 [Branchiostoma floridae x Branchiostoma japonicum]